MSRERAHGERSGRTFSQRSGCSSTPNALTVSLDRIKTSGRPWLDLTESNPTRAGIPYPEESILSALADPRSLVYEPHPFGLASAREAVARELRRPGLAASHLVLTASTSEAYMFVFKLLCDPGDEVLVPAPSYPLFEHLARFECVRLVPYRLAYDGQWHVDVDSLRRAAGPRTRAVLVVSPNNPTGSYLKKVELEAIASLGLPIVSDEVFAAYSFGPDSHRVESALEAEGSLVFALGGLSKLAALPQMKLAWMAVGGPDEERAIALERLELIADSALSIGTPVQHALPALLDHRSPSTEAIRARTRENLDALGELLGPTSPATVLRVEGGWYATVRLPRTQGEEQWALDLLEGDGVYAHPGHFFDFEDEPYLVLSLLTKTSTFREGARRLAARVIDRS